MYLFIYSSIYFLINYKLPISTSIYLLCFLPIPIILYCLIKDDVLTNKILLYIWVPNIIIEVIFVIFTGDGFLHRGISAYPSIIIIPMLLDSSKLENSSFLLKNSYFIFSIIFLTSTLLTMYSIVYRDVDILETNCIVESGVYKGIITDKKRCNGLVKLEETIRKYTEKFEFILFLDNVPMAYLMNNGIPFTPSTWDISAYTYGFNDDFLYKTYFKHKKNLPNKIIYIDTGRDELVSIMKEGYNFSEFVKLRYTLIKVYKDDIYPVYIYELKEEYYP